MLLNACRDIGLAVNTGKTRNMEMGRHRGTMANQHITLGTILYKQVKVYAEMGGQYWNGS